MRTLAHTRRTTPPDSANETPSRERQFWLIALALLSLHILLAWIARPGGIGTLQDDSIYLFLARSLRTLGYQDLYIVGSPTHSMYPPGYPALLALLGIAVGERVAVAQALGVGFSAAALGLFTICVRRLWSAPIALACLAAMVVNPHLVGTAGKIGTDAPYLLFSMIVLWVLTRNNPSRQALVVAATAAIAAALTRSVGVTLLAALGAYWLLERRFTATALFTTASAATVGLWILWTIVAPEQYVGRSYIADATYRHGVVDHPFVVVLLGRSVVNLSQYFGNFIPNRIGIPPLPGLRFLELIAATGVGVGLIAGLIVLWQRWRLAALYLLAYGGLLTIWAWSIGRFLNVIIPLLILGVLVGLRAVADRVRPRSGMYVLIGVAASLTLFGSIRSVKLFAERNSCKWGSQLPPPGCRPDVQDAFFRTLEYIRLHAPADAVLVTGKPAPAYYFTGRQTLPVGRVESTSAAGFIDFLQEENVQYVILGWTHPAEYTTLAPRLEENCADLVLEATFDPHTYLFRIPRTTSADTLDGEACRAMRIYRSVTNDWRRGSRDDG